MAAKVRVLFVGTPDTAVTVLDQLVEASNGGDAAAPISIVGVLTREDAPVGRKKVLTPSPVAVRADELRLPVFKANQLRGEQGSELADWLAEINPDIAAVVAYGAIIPVPALELIRHGWVNLHFSVLPAYRGAAPVQQTMIDRAYTAGGYSIFQIEEGLDTGPVFAQRSHPIDPEATSGEVLGQMAVAGGKLLAETLPGIVTGQLTAEPQVGQPSYAGKLTTRDSLIDPARTSAEVIGLINGTIPEPGPWAHQLVGSAAGTEEAKPQRLKFDRVRPVEDEVLGAADAPGTIRLIGKKAYLRCQDRVVELTGVQPAGKKMMNATDWLRGQADSVAYIASSTTHPELFEPAAK